VGGRKNPIWRIVAADQRAPRDGRNIEILGQYNPQTSPSTIVVDEDKVRGWLEHGAQATPQVRKLLRTQGIDVPA
jgi:small subunit ribosomal protein S16